MRVQAPRYRTSNKLAFTRATYQVIQDVTRNVCLLTSWVPSRQKAQYGVVIGMRERDWLSAG